MVEYDFKEEFCSRFEVGFLFGNMGDFLLKNNK